MAKDIYFNNVAPNREDQQPKTVRRRPANPAPTPVPQPTRERDNTVRGNTAYGAGQEEPVRRAPARRNRDTAVPPPVNRTQRQPDAAAPPPAPSPRPKKKRSSPPPAKVDAPPKKKKKHIFRKCIVLLLLICLLLPVLAGYELYRKVLSVYEPVAMQKSGVVDQASLMYSSDVYNILLMGVDEADVDSATRSDSMILMSVNRRTHQIKLTTFMRDMYVTIPGYGETKLNHACMYEGPQLTIDTIELNFGVRIDAYAKIGYDIFIELVNGVGGITVAELDETECRALAEEGVQKEPGTNIYFTGEEAIKYVRIRHWQSDFARTERQREVVTLIIDRAKKTPPHKLISLAQSIAAKIECTIPKKDLIRLAFDILPCLSNGISQQQIPADGTWSDATRDSLMVLLVDFERNKAIIKSFIYGG